MNEDFGPLREAVDFEGLNSRAPRKTSLPPLLGKITSF